MYLLYDDKITKLGSTKSLNLKIAKLTYMYYKITRLKVS